MDNWRQYREVREGEFIIVAGDCSAGGNDKSCCQFLSQNKTDIPLVYHSPKLATEMTSDIFPVLNKISDITGINPLVAFERNNGGLFEMERLAAMNRYNKYDIFKMPTIGRDHNGDIPVRYGWDTNTATRPAMLSQLKEAVEKKVIKIYDKQTIEEMFSFIVCQTSSSWKAQAEKNAHDDLVISLAIVWQLYQMTEHRGKRRDDDYGVDSNIKFNPMTV